LGFITPAQEINDLAGTCFVAMGVIVSWIRFSPAAISIKDHTYMLWGLGKIQGSN
jgi:hypothetical protein